MGWTVAVTGPTGDIGISAVDALDQSPEDTSKAKSQLGWAPKHTAAETLAALAKAV